MNSTSTKSDKKRKIVKGGTFGYEEKNKEKLCRDLADIFEGLHGDKITIVPSNKQYGNHISDYNEKDGKKQYNIQVIKTANRSTKTALEDSLAHILTKSPISTFRNNKDEMINWTPVNHRSKVNQMSETIFSAFENKRAESWSASIYQGYKERVTEANKLDGEELITEITNPVEALNAARLGLTEMVANSEFPEANDFMKSVERTMPKASVLLTNDYIERVLKPWYQKITSDEEPENQPEGEENDEEGEGEGEGENENQGENEGKTEGDEQGETEGEGENEGEGDSEGQGEGTSQKQPKWKNDKPSEAQKNYIEKLGGDKNYPDTKGEASEYIEKLINGDDPAKGSSSTPDDKTDDKAENEINKAAWSNLQSINNDDTTGCDPTVDFENDTVEELQKEGEEEIEKLEEKLSEMNDIEIPKKYDVQDKIDHVLKRAITTQKLPLPTAVNYDKITVSRLKQLFKKIKSKASQELSDSGNDVDVDQYIRNQIEGGHEFLLNDVEQKGFAVVIGVDESGSMANGNMDSAKKLCATLYKAFEEMPNVDIYVFGWTSGHDEATGKSGVIIKKISKFSEVGSLRATGGTPFLEATYYIADFVEKLPHSKKLMFQITDGDVYVDDTLLHYFSKLRKSKIEITGIQISGFQSQSMIDLFGKTNYIQTPSMDKINGAMTKNIVSKFMRCMK